MNESFESIGAASESQESLEIYKKFVDQEKGIFSGLRGKFENFAKVLGLFTAMAGLSAGIPTELHARGMKNTNASEQFDKQNHEVIVKCHKLFQNSVAYYYHNIDIEAPKPGDEITPEFMSKTENRPEAIKHFISEFIDPFISNCDLLISEGKLDRQDIKQLQNESLQLSDFTDNIINDFAEKGTTNVIGKKGSTLFSLAGKLERYKKNLK